MDWQAFTKPGATPRMEEGKDAQLVSQNPCKYSNIKLVLILRRATGSQAPTQEVSNPTA